MKSKKFILLVCLIIASQLHHSNLSGAQETFVSSEKSIEDYHVQQKIDGLQSPYDQVMRDDILWISEYNSSKLWKFNTKNESISYIDLEENITPLAISLAQDRSIWFVDFNFRPQIDPDFLVRFDPDNNTFHYIELPSEAQPLHLVMHEQLAVVSILNLDKILIVNTNTYEINELNVPCDESCGPADIGFDSKGTMWIMDTIGNRLVKYNNSTEQFTFYELPFRVSSPTFIVIDENDILYTGTHSANIVLKINLRTMEMTEFHQPQTPPHSYPTSGLLDIEIAPSGDIWVAEHFINKLGRIEIETGTTHEYFLSNEEPLIQNILSTEDRIWYTEEDGFINYIDLNKVPTVKITNMGDIELNVGIPTKIEFNAEYASGMDDEIEFNIFAEVRNKPQFRFYGNLDDHSLKNGENKDFSISVLLNTELYSQNYSIVYGINSTTFSATQSITITFGTNYLWLQTTIPLVLVLIVVFVRRETLMSYLKKKELTNGLEE